MGIALQEFGDHFVIVLLPNLAGVVAPATLFDP
jgi:hypothetical protein